MNELSEKQFIEQVIMNAVKSDGFKIGQRTQYQTENIIDNIVLSAVNVRRKRFDELDGKRKV